MNDMVHATERVSFSYADPRATFGSSEPDWWRVIWMAVSCCCGMEGEMEIVRLPTTNPSIYH